jgi:hypothetical protein
VPGRDDSLVIVWRVAHPSHRLESFLGALPFAPFAKGGSWRFTEICNPDKIGSFRITPHRRNPKPLATPADGHPSASQKNLLHCAPQCCGTIRFLAQGASP